MIDDKLYAERLKICHQCEHCLIDENRCVKVAIPTDPTRRGKFDHPQGLGNPKTRCPIGKFNYIKSQHAIKLQEYLPWELNDTQLYLLTHAGITERNILAWMTYIHDRFQELGLTIKRSEIATKLITIKQTNNN